VLLIVSVFVASGIQHAMRLRHIVICGLPGCTIFFYDFRKKKWLLNIKCGFPVSLQLFIWKFFSF